MSPPRDFVEKYIYKGGSFMLQDLPGITSIFPHLSVVFGLWLFGVIVTRWVKSYMLKTIGGDDVFVERVNNYARISFHSISYLAVLASVVIIFFLTSPFEKRAEDMENITPAQVNQEFVPLSKEHIEMTNEKSVSRQSEKKQAEAKSANAHAMEDVAKLFQSAADQADESKK